MELHHPQDLARSIWAAQSVKQTCREYGFEFDIEYRPKNNIFVFYLYYVGTVYVDSIEMPVTSFEYYSGSTEASIIGINNLITCMEMSYKKFSEVPASQLWGWPVYEPRELKYSESRIKPAPEQPMIAGIDPVCKFKLA